MASNLHSQKTAGPLLKGGLRCRAIELSPHADPPPAGANQPAENWGGKIRTPVVEAPVAAGKTRIQRGRATCGENREHFEGVVIGAVRHDSEQLWHYPFMTAFERQVAGALEPIIRKAMRIGWDSDDVALAVAPRVAAAITAVANATESGTLQTPKLATIEQAALAALRWPK
jgi:hypothetical protein